MKGLALNDRILDFVGRYAPAEEKKRTSQRSVEFLFNEQVLSMLVETDNCEALEHVVHNALTDSNADHLTIVLENYHKLRNSISDELVIDLAEYILDKNLIHTLRETSCTVFAHRLTETGNFDLIKKFGYALIKYQEFGNAISLFNSISDEQGLSEVVLSMQGNRNYDHMTSQLEKIKSQNIFESTVDKIVSGIEANPKPQAGQIRGFVSLLTKDKKKYQNQLSKLLDAYKEQDGLNFTDNVTLLFDIFSALNGSALSKKTIETQLQGIAYDCAEHCDAESFDQIVYNYKDFKVEIDKSVVLQRIEKAARRAIEVNSEPKDLHHFFSFLRMSGVDAHKWCAERYIEAGKHKEAIKELKQIKSNEVNKAGYETAMKVAEKGDIGNAFAMLSEFNLNYVNTNNHLFYKTIASSILSLYLMHDSFDSNSLKDMINGEIKSNLVESLDVISEWGGQHIVINFEGNKQYRYFRKRFNGCRNNVDLFVTKSPEDGLATSVLKFYHDSESGKNEKFWLNLFEGRFGIPKLISTEHFGKFKVNQIEEKGKSFRGELQGCAEQGWTEDGEKKECFEQAINLYQQMFEFMQKNSYHIEQNVPVNKKIDGEYCGHRFDSLIADLNVLGHKDLAQRLDKSKWYYSDIISYSGERKGSFWIHGDYAPRNLAYSFGRRQAISVLDFETAAKGHPVQDMVSLLHNPENEVSEIAQKGLEKTAAAMLSSVGVKAEQTKQLWQPYRAFWAVRQARGISSAIINGTATEKDIAEFNWYIDDLKKALDKTTEKEARNYYGISETVFAGKNRSE